MTGAHHSGCPISMPLDVLLAWFVWVAGFVARSGGYDGSGPRFPCFTKGTGEPEIYVEDWHGYPCPEAARSQRREETTFGPLNRPPKGSPVVAGGSCALRTSEPLRGRCRSDARRVVAILVRIVLHSRRPVPARERLRAF